MHPAIHSALIDARETELRTARSGRVWTAMRVRRLAAR
jgi:hypothetical protein